LARFCTEEYEKPTVTKGTNLFSQLTNYSLNKVHSEYKHPSSRDDIYTANKRPMSVVLKQMEKCGINSKRLWREIEIIVVKTIIAMIPEIMINYERWFFGCDAPQCFQLLGLDIIVRDDGVPMLLEVNASPSLTLDHIPEEGE
uniref:Tubulin--tyrosine ligase-like protein 9 n=1 Tax=Heligmosomoides polygyrus TaxID=6339 RepID=A0A183FBQ4_HELPZ